jgi:hypothetical protein
MLVAIGWYIRWLTWEAVTMALRLIGYSAFGVDAMESTSIFVSAATEPAGEDIKRIAN